MSRNPSGRSWYRLSSIVRPTPHSSRDPSPPRRAIESPPSPPSPPSPKEVKEAKRSPVPSPWSREKHEPTPKPRHHEHETKQGPSDKTNLVHGPNKEHQLEESLKSRAGPEDRQVSFRSQDIVGSTLLVPQHQPPLSLRSPPKEVKETKPSPVRSPRFIRHESPKPRYEHDTTHNMLTSSDKTNLVHGPNKTQQQQRQSPPSPPKEVKEAKPSPVPSPRFTKHDPKLTTLEPSRPRHEHETTHHTKILTTSEKTAFVLNRPNKEQQEDSNISSSDADDFVIGTQGVITISAENKGAVMDIVRKTRGGTGKGEEGNSKTKKHNSKNGENLPMDSFVNSNVQMINGSVVYNTKEKHHDPGVHLSLYRNPLGFIIKDHGNGYTSSIN